MRPFRIAWPAAAAFALLGVSGGSGLFTFYYAEGASYLSNDPKACVNCHIMRDHYDGWQKTSHHAFATCNDCHIPEGGLAKYAVKAENGFWHSARFTFQDYHEPIRIRPKNSVVLNQNCVRCHADLVEDVTRPHAGDPAQFDCIRCHVAVGHGPTR